MRLFELRWVGKNLLSVGRYCGHWFVWLGAGESIVLGGTERFAAKMHLFNAVRAMRWVAATGDVTEGTEI